MGNATAARQGILAENMGDTCSGNTLYETYCATNSNGADYYVSTEFYTCPNGCLNGFCVTCIDSDAGENPNVFGNVTVNGVVFRDYCYSSNQVYEFRCEGNLKRESILGCSSCSNGACVPFSGGGSGSNNGNNS